MNIITRLYRMINRSLIFLCINLLSQPGWLTICFVFNNNKKTVPFFLSHLAQTCFMMFFFFCFFFDWITQLAQKKWRAKTIMKFEYVSRSYRVWTSNLQSFWPNWFSVEEERNTSCCDVPCILFSTVSGHACHSSPLHKHCGQHPCDPVCCSFSQQIFKCL